MKNGAFGRRFAFLKPARSSRMRRANLLRGPKARTWCEFPSSAITPGPDRRRPISGDIVDADQAIQTNARLDQTVGAGLQVEQLRGDVARFLVDFFFTMKIAQRRRFDLRHLPLQAALAIALDTLHDLDTTNPLVVGMAQPVDRLLGWSLGAAGKAGQ